MDPTLSSEPQPLIERWSPQMTPHVEGRYAVRGFDEQGFPKPQPFLCKCSVCGDSWGSICMSGNVRSHIVSFAARHLHRDPLAAPDVQRPGSMRVKAGPDGEYVKV
jgi:hypothetical protein